MTADIQDQQGGYDPWWQDKTGGSNVEQSILFKCDVGKIFKSIDGGQSWNDVTPTTDPPNAWGDVTAPTVAGLTFIQRVDNIHIEDQHIFLCRQTGANRAWLLKTSDGGITWDWTTLSSVNYDGTYLYAVRDCAGCVVSGANAWRYSNVANGLGEDDGNTLYWEKVTGDCSGQNALGGVTMTAVFDFGIQAVLTDVGVKSKGDASTSGQDVRFAAEGSGYDADICSFDTTTRDGTSTTWYHADSDLTWYNLGDTNNPERYLQLRLNGAVGDSDGVTCHIDAVRTSASVTIPDIIPIWMDVDTQDGSILWITYWSSDDELWLQKRDTANLNVLVNIDLGACTEAQLNAFTYVAYPFTPAFDNSIVFVYGRMNNPQSLGDPSHLIKTSDTGDTWSLVDGSLGSDYIGALQGWAFGTSGVDWELVFIRNVVAGSAGEFWRGVNTPLYKSDTTFQVNQDALTVYNNNIAIGAIAAVGGEAVNLSTDGGATWTDITGTHPAGASGEVKSLVYV